MKIIERVIPLLLLALLIGVPAALAQFSGYPPAGYLQIGNDSVSAPTWQPNPSPLKANNLSDLPSPGTARINLGLGTVATQNANAVTITGGTITGMAAPSAATDVANKLYVDSSAVGLTVHPAARLATTGALPSNTYANGTSGVGATLTATANAALSVDGTAVATNDRILVRAEAAPANNGIYTVTNTGSGAAAYVLTRATDANTAGTQNPAAIGQGTYVVVTAGSTLANSAWTVNSQVTTIGTSAITWALFSSSTAAVSSIGGMTGNINCGNGLNCSAGSISLGAPIVVPTRTLTSGASTPLSATTDYYLCVNKTTGSATAVTLPASPAVGLTYRIKDCKGDAASNPITISGSVNIDGSASYVLNFAYQSVGLVYNGATWSSN